MRGAGLSCRKSRGERVEIRGKGGFRGGLGVVWGGWARLSGADFSSTKTFPSSFPLWGNTSSNSGQSGD